MPSTATVALTYFTKNKEHNAQIKLLQDTKYAIHQLGRYVIILGNEPIGNLYGVQICQYFNVHGCWIQRGACHVISDVYS